MTEEMFGGQHRIDEARRAERAGWAQTKYLGAKSAITRTQKCAPRKQKRNQNTLDEAVFVRDVDKSRYHQLSHNEIAGNYAYSRQLSVGVSSIKAGTKSVYKHHSFPNRHANARLTF